MMAPYPVVWKFKLYRGFQVLDLPAEAEPLCVRMQGGERCIWLRVNPNLPNVCRRFEIRNTGQSGAVGKYIGTLFESDGYVGHVFEVPF